MSLWHDPSDERCRNPVGSVRVGCPVGIDLHVTRVLANRVVSVDLLVRDGDERAIAMERRFGAGAGGADLYGAVVQTGGSARVITYRFLVTFADDTHVLYACDNDGRLMSGVAVADGESARGFQLTVYEPDFTTPSWTHGAVMYQIFPDRFCRHSEDAFIQGIEAHKAMGRPVTAHGSWDEAVSWKPDPGTDKHDPVDFFGGSLAGIERHLDYLEYLGVDVVYLNPVFEARSNHRYDTADYTRIDPILGDAAAFESLARAARRRGIRIVMDAVLSHTGSDSRYFNRLGTYDAPGAWQAHSLGRVSDYTSWYDFEHPCEDVPYRCWWGEETLPEVEEHDPTWQRYMFADGGVLPTWLNRGAAGYRLDVADELPDDVLTLIRDTVKSRDSDAVVIGEVWEDPTTKVSYDHERRYALGGALDSVMNYPLRDELLGFACEQRDAYQLAWLLEHQRLNYPPPMYDCLMNLLGSHDVERLRSVLALGRTFKDLSRADQLELVGSISDEQDLHGARLQALTATVVWSLPGMPTLYYGDEKGLHAGSDPFCRATMPWADGPRRADVGLDLCDFYHELGDVRHRFDVLRLGSTRTQAVSPDVLCVLREAAESSNTPAVLCVSNRLSEEVEATFDLLTHAARERLSPHEIASAKQVGHRSAFFDSAHAIGVAEDVSSIAIEGYLARFRVGPCTTALFEL